MIWFACQAANTAYPVPKIVAGSGEQWAAMERRGEIFFEPDEFLKKNDACWVAVSLISVAGQ
jgi:hypothetical protein